MSMKVLQVNCVYRKGSTGKIVNDIDVCLKRQGIESIVCYGRGATINEKGVYKFCTEIEAKIHALLIRLGFVLPYGGNWLATQRLIKRIKQENPDVVHLHCINGSCVNIYKLLQFLGVNNFKTIVTHHAEFFYTGSCGHSYDCQRFMFESGCGDCPILYEATKSRTIDRTREAWQMMKKAFSYFKKENLMFTAVSDWVKERSKLSPIVNSFKCETVLNGIDTETFNNKGIIDRYWLKLRIPNLRDKIAVHVTASFAPNTDNIKGSKYIIELAKLMPDVSFIVAAIAHGDLTNLPDNVHFFGRTADQKELAALYRAADLTVLTSKRETFSMIVAESLCCGTPIVGFKAGGPETIAIPEYSRFVDYGDIETLHIEIEKMLYLEWENNIISERATAFYSKEKMCESYYSWYKNLNNKN